MKLSAIIITKNASTEIEDCISSIKFADEIIVIDNQSTDQTKEVAKKAGATVYTVDAKDFSYLRNVGREKATGEWLLYIDSDERVSGELSEEIRNSIKISHDISGYTLPRRNFFFHYPCPKLEKMLRLMRKDTLVGWEGVVHETPRVGGEIGHLTHPLLHYTHNDISSMIEKTNQWSEFEAQLRFQNHHPRMSWWRFFRVTWTGFSDSYIKNELWKMGTVGLIESMYQGFSMFITYAKLWELQNKTIQRKQP
jgi:glycosyltransferase involved in cell wall biosynthesis